MSQPTHEHDCTECVFLGTTIGGGRIHDLYYHASVTGGDDTLIARRSSEGADYSSCPVSFARPNGTAELWAAKALWEKARDPLDQLEDITKGGT